MDNFIFDKTDKGREEIITRKYRLQHRLRSLLVLIDGKKTTPELLQKVSGLGLDMQSLEELVDGEFIEGVAIVPESEMEQLIAANPAPVAPPPVAKVAEAVAVVEFEAPAAPADNGGNGGGNGAAKSKGVGGMMSPAAFTALQTFFNQTIKSMVGLRGFTLQLKAERAHTLDEFRALREPYLAAIQKAKGNEIMISLRDRLDQLLRDGEDSMA